MFLISEKTRGVELLVIIEIIENGKVKVENEYKKKNNYEKNMKGRIDFIL